MRLLLALTAAVLFSLSSPAAELQVFAAASLTNALKEIAPGFEKATGNVLRFNFAGSNVLARQIQEGAPADLFFSADEMKMDQLDKAGLLLENTRLPLLSNSLVVVVPADGTVEVRSAQDLPKLKLLALADPKGVPAGIYAKEYLEKSGVWAALQGRIVATENVRAALAAVEAGNADAGVVYKTDAGISNAVKIAYEVARADGPKITYPIAVVKDSANAQAARDLINYLKSEAAAASFKKYGFIVSNGEL